MNKTNAMRMLDKAKIAYEAKEYIPDENDLSGVNIARQIGLPAGQCFKTIVTKGDKTGPVVFCIPADREIDLKQAARITGNKKIEPIHVKDLLALTGYVRGACSPLGMKKKFPTYFDASSENFEKIAVSGGVCGLTLMVKREDLLTVLDAKSVDIIK